MPPLISSLVELIRRHTIDLIAGLVLLGIVVCLVAVLLGGNPRLLLIRESFLTVALGIACLLSLLFPRPLWFYLTGYVFATNDPQRCVRR